MAWCKFGTIKSTITTIIDAHDLWEKQAKDHYDAQTRKFCQKLRVKKTNSSCS